jgi:FkbM family methyltransferase
MKELIYQLLRVRGVLRRMSHLGFGTPFRRRLLLTYLRTLFLPRYGSEKGVCDIAGYKMRYCNYASFLYLFRELFLNGEYYFISGTDKPFILDCGSNIGMSVLYFKARFPNAEIIAFEPDADAFACLEENVLLNSFKGVSVNNKAVSGKDGTVDFWRAIEKNGSLGNTMYANSFKRKVTVESAKLSNYVDRKVDFLKLDVEGAEREVIEDLANSGKLKMIERMFIEYHLHMSEAHDAFSKLLGILEASGFGYQLGAVLERPFRGEQFQALHIYAYNKTTK